MPQKFLVGNLEGEKSGEFKDLPIKPRPGPGKESRVITSPRSFISEIQIHTGKFSKKRSPSGLKRGHGVVHREARIFQQRVLIKSRVVRTKGKGSRGLDDHVSYLQNDFDHAGIRTSAEDLNTAKLARSFAVY